mmetsp:Transcript_107188/g.288665  ORF Transcript_107188/g.288665 Transcript_107188/m.288665 type:complete len:115 (+) Transcript_107188:516-860(+)
MPGAPSTLRASRRPAPATAVAVTATANAGARSDTPALATATATPRPAGKSSGGGSRQRCPQQRKHDRGPAVRQGAVAADGLNEAGSIRPGRARPFPEAEATGGAEAAGRTSNEA